MKKMITLLMMISLLFSACGAATDSSQLATGNSGQIAEDTSDVAPVDSSEHTDYNKLLYESQYVSITLDALYRDRMEFTVESKMQNNKCSVNLETIALDGLVSPTSYSETSWLELNPGDKTKATINTELNYTEHKYLSAFFEVFNDEGNGVEEISVVNYELGEKENIEYAEPQEILAYDSATLSIFYVGPDENGIRLRAKNKRDRAVHMVLDAPYKVNDEDVGEYTNASPIPPNATSDYYVNVKEFNADYSPDSVSSFSSTGRTYDGQDIDVFSISSSKEVEPYSGEEYQSNVPQAASSQGKSTVLDSSSGENSDESSSVTENAANISSRLQINEYKKNRVEKYINCFKNAGVEYNVSANGCYVVGKDTEREILDKKYRILELSCSLYSQYKNTINNGVEVQYQVHKELGLEESDPHTKLIYEFYSMAENNPVDLNNFISTVNDALDQKNEDPILEGDTYSVYLSISRSDVVPSTVHFVSYDSVPCNLSQSEDYNYLEFDSLEEREDFIDRVESTINDNDLNVKGIIHEYANESNLKSHDNNLGLAMKFTLYASFTNGVPVEDYRDLLVKPIEAIGLDYIIDKDVTAEDIANEIISCSQIRKYSEETKMYIEYNPDYRDYNTCALREKYAFNPLRCQQYAGLTYGVCGVVMDDFDTMHLFVPAKVQGLKNK